MAGGTEVKRCWHHIFLDDPCPNPGVWQSPPRLCSGLGGDFAAAVRWCDDHRFSDDVPVDAGDWRVLA